MPRVAGWAAAPLLAILAFAAPAGAEEPPAAAPPAPPAPAAKPLSLDRAVQKGLLEVRGASPTGYQTVLLVLRNRSTEPLTVDLAGRHLVPTTGNVQRLGLSFPTGPTGPKAPREPRPDAGPGTVPVTLEPGELREIRMNSCCMDSGKACPRSQDKYVLASAPTPPAVEVALRWWVDHPKAPQGFVNASIWQGDPRLLDRPPPEEGASGRASGAEAPPWPKGKSVRSYGGILYLLDDGALTSVDPEGVRRFHATGIHQAFPQADGLLGVGRGAEGRELWRFGVTGDPPWSSLFAMPAADVLDLVGFSGGSFLVRGKDGLSFRANKAAPGAAVELRGRDDAEAKAVEFGVLDAVRGRAVAFVWRKGRPPGGSLSSANVTDRAEKVDVFDVNGRTGVATLRKTYWNVRHLGAGPAGVFALTPAGRLERLDGERFVRLPSDRDWKRVAAVGAGRLLLVGEEDGLCVYDLSSGRATPVPPGASDVTLDPVTDDLVWMEGDSAIRWSPGLASPESIPLR